MDLTVNFKKGPPKMLIDITEIKVGSKLTSPIYSGNNLEKVNFPSTEDITIKHSKGIFIIAKNTFSTIEFTI